MCRTVPQNSAAACELAEAGLLPALGEDSQPSMLQATATTCLSSWPQTAAYVAEEPASVSIVGPVLAGLSTGGVEPAVPLIAFVSLPSHQAALKHISSAARNAGQGSAAVCTADGEDGPPTLQVVAADAESASAAFRGDSGSRPRHATRQAMRTSRPDSKQQSGSMASAGRRTSSRTRCC